MAIELPLLAAKQQIQEQGRQQRKTQRDRFVQNLGQTILGSALQLGTTLGVEHFKETRPSKIAATKYTTVAADKVAEEAKRLKALQPFVVKRELAEVNALLAQAGNWKANTQETNQKVLASSAQLYNRLGVTQNEKGEWGISVPDETEPVVPSAPVSGVDVIPLPGAVPLRPSDAAAPAGPPTISPTRLGDRPTAAGFLGGFDAVPPRPSDAAAPLPSPLGGTPGRRWVPLKSDEGRRLADERFKRTSLAERMKGERPLRPGEARMVSTTSGALPGERWQGSVSRPPRPLDPKAPKAWQSTAEGKQLMKLIEPYQDANQQGPRRGSPLAPGEVSSWVSSLTGKLEKNWANVETLHARVLNAPPLNDLISLTPAQPRRESREGERQFIDTVEKALGGPDRGWVEKVLPDLDFNRSEDRRALALAAGAVTGLFDIDQKTLQPTATGGGADAVGVGTMAMVGSPMGAHDRIMEYIAREDIYKDLPPGGAPGASLRDRLKGLPEDDRKARLAAGRATMKLFLSMTAYLRDALKTGQQVPLHIQRQFEESLRRGRAAPPVGAPAGGRDAFGNPIIVPKL
jgi:hypothetical protein